MAESETDEAFVERMQSTWEDRLTVEDMDRLFALARRGAEAASRIKHLEAALKLAADRMNCFGMKECAKEARAALEDRG